MQFLVAWEFIDASEPGEKRSLEIFGRWQPPEGTDFQAFYSFADNSGGFAIIEADSAEALAEATAPFVPWLRFSAKPIVPIEKATEIALAGIASRDPA